MNVKKEVKLRILLACTLSLGVFTSVHAAEIQNEEYYPISSSDVREKTEGVAILNLEDGKQVIYTRNETYATNRHPGLNLTDPKVQVNSPGTVFISTGGQDDVMNPVGVYVLSQTREDRNPEGNTEVINPPTDVTIDAGLNINLKNANFPMDTILVAEGVYVEATGDMDKPANATLTTKKAMDITVENVADSKEAVDIEGEHFLLEARGVGVSMLTHQKATSAWTQDGGPVTMHIKSTGVEGVAAGIFTSTSRGENTISLNQPVTMNITATGEKGETHGLLSVSHKNSHATLNVNGSIHIVAKSATGKAHGITTFTGLAILSKEAEMARKIIESNPTVNDQDWTFAPGVYTNLVEHHNSPTSKLVELTAGDTAFDLDAWLDAYKKASGLPIEDFKKEAARLSKELRTFLDSKIVLTPDPSTTKVMYKAPVTIQVAVEHNETSTPVDAAGISVTAKNTGKSEMSFEAPVKIDVTGDKVPYNLNPSDLHRYVGSYGVSVQTDTSGDAQLTFKDTAEITLHGEDRSVGVYANTTRKGTTTIAFNKGITIDGAHLGINAANHFDKMRTPGGDTKITVDGGDIHITAVDPVVSNLNNPSMDTFAVLANGGKTSISLNESGEHTVALKGNVESIRDAHVNITLSQPNSSIVGDVLARDTGIMNLTLRGDGVTLQGAADDKSDTSTAADDFTNPGRITLNLEDGAIWHMTKASAVMNLHVDNATVDMSKVVPGDRTKTLASDVRTLSGNGTFLMNLAPVAIDEEAGKKENSTILRVQETLEGTHNITFTAEPAAGWKSAEGTVLARTNVNKGTFVVPDLVTGTFSRLHLTLATKPIPAPEKSANEAAGVHEGYSQPTYTTDWYIKSVENQQASLANPMADMVPGIAPRLATYAAWRNIMSDDTLMKRMGDLRAGANMDGIWFRTKHGRVSANGSSQFSLPQHEYSLGYDVAHPRTNGDVYTGASVQWIHGKLSSTVANDSTRSYGVSLYRTERRNDASYLDTVLRLQRFNGNLHSVDASSDYHAWGLMGSVEYGKRFATKTAFYVEPQAQLTLGRLYASEFRYGDMTVHNKPVNSLITRFGVKAGTAIGTRGEVYATLNWLHEFGGDIGYRFASGNESLALTDHRNGSWWQYGAGFAVHSASQYQVYGEVQHTSRDTFNSHWSWNLGVRYQF